MSATEDYIAFLSVIKKAIQIQGNDREKKFGNFWTVDTINCGMLRCTKENVGNFALSSRPTVVQRFNSRGHCTFYPVLVFSRVLRDSTPRYIGPLVGRSVPLLLFRRFCCSCPNALMNFPSTAPAHLHATGVAVYPALFDYVLVTMTMCLVVSS